MAGLEKAKPMLRTGPRDTLDRRLARGRRGAPTPAFAPGLVHESRRTAPCRAMRRGMIGRRRGWAQRPHTLVDERRPGLARRPAYRSRPGRQAAAPRSGPPSGPCSDQLIAPGRGPLPPHCRPTIIRRRVTKRRFNEARCGASQVGEGTEKRRCSPHWPSSCQPQGPASRLAGLQYNAHRFRTCI